MVCNAATWRSTAFDPNINCFVKVLSNTCHNTATDKPPPKSTKSKGAFLLVRQPMANKCALHLDHCHVDRVNHVAICRSATMQFKQTAWCCLQTAPL